MERIWDNRNQSWRGKNGKRLIKQSDLFISTVKPVTTFTGASRILS